MAKKHFAVALMLLVGACAQSPAATTTSSSAPTPTTVLTTTAPTTTAPTTTTTTPTVDVTVRNADPALAIAVTSVYRWAHDPSTPQPPLPDGLAELMAGLASGTGTLVVEAEVSSQHISAPTGEATLAVVTADDDVILAVADPDWRIVGAKLARFGLPAWYGDEPMFLLVIGTDARPGQIPIRARADSIHIVSLLPSRGIGAIIGFPRDTLVTAPDGLTDKFTHILAKRDIDTMVATARALTDLPVEAWDLTGFQGFVALVDALGGFDIEVPRAMADSASKAYFQAGPQRFDGTDALAFSRNRHLPGGDLTRSYHQGLVMLAALTEVQKLGIERLPTWLGYLTDFTEFSMTPDELLRMSAAAYELDPSTVPNVVLPATFGTYKGASIVELTDDAYDILRDVADGALDDS